MYSVKLKQFEGPLDLLLHMVDKRKLDITEISLASLVDEYQKYMLKLQKLNLEIESSYLTVFASLLEIKSKVLLPEPPKVEDETPQEHTLVIQLRQYKEAKEMAKILQTLKEEEEARFIRTSILEPVDHIVFTTQITPKDLMEIYLQTIRKFKLREEKKEITLKKEEISFPFMLRLIAKKISKCDTTSMYKLFESPPSKIQFILTFLALLEMAREQRIKLMQKDSDIIIVNRKKETFDAVG